MYYHDNSLKFPLVIRIVANYSKYINKFRAPDDEDKGDENKSGESKKWRKQKYSIVVWNVVVHIISGAVNAMAVAPAMQFVQ